jgi:hypothetical protein
VLLVGYEAPSFKRRGINLPPKPKGMHWHTYDRVANCYQVYDDRWAVAVWRGWGRRIG